MLHLQISANDKSTSFNNNFQFLAKSKIDSNLIPIQSRSFRVIITTVSPLISLIAKYHILFNNIITWKLNIYNNLSPTIVSLLPPARNDRNRCYIWRQNWRKLKARNSFVVAQSIMFWTTANDEDDNIISYSQLCSSYEWMIYTMKMKRWRRQTAACYLSFWVEESALYN